MEASQLFRTSIPDRKIDFYPTHQIGEFRLRYGKPFPFGASLTPVGINFSVYSRHAVGCTLVLFEKSVQEPVAEIPFPDSFRVGNVWCMVVYDLDPEKIEYGYRMDGPFMPVEGHRFDTSHILLDPYAKAVGGRDVWGEKPDLGNQFPFRGRLIFEDFDWEDDRLLEIPSDELVIYEMHVRGFTRHPASGTRHPGTFAAISEKIPHLKSLGVNCVELLPVCEFDEFENKRKNPENGEPLLNYWGYSPFGFFAPKAGYAATGCYGLQVDEFKTLIKMLHKNGIEVILDVVFNHTAEGDERGPAISFRGLDNKTYYMIGPDGRYLNFSGCGNTLNCNNPIVRNLVLDCLRYWVAEYHIDGFRFDLASILGRDPHGSAMHNPPLLETLSYDPVLGRCKLIAEAWDAGGLYQVGSFPDYGRWAEWNGKYRDEIRCFMKGDTGIIRAFPSRIMGSPDLYEDDNRGPTASINFLSCHDGFTLYDLFSYDFKHNEMNGELNRDGANENFSWNCGVEGETDDPSIRSLRFRMIKNAWSILMTSQGIPMIQMGDEVGRTQLGNNNTYCQDNEISWFDWSLVEKNQELFRFAKKMITFRQKHPALRQKHFLKGIDHLGTGLPDISWHGVHVNKPDWSFYSHSVAFLLDGRYCTLGDQKDDIIYVAFNFFWEALTFDIPHLPRGYQWRILANTGAAYPEDIHEPGLEPVLPNQVKITLEPRSTVILVGKK